ncbi:hypothetical protein GEMRC1_004470 [Eukaryota sp. GEM-RC1]
MSIDFVLVRYLTVLRLPHCQEPSMGLLILRSLLCLVCCLITQDRQVFMKIFMGPSILKSLLFLFCFCLITQDRQVFMKIFMGPSILKSLLFLFCFCYSTAYCSGSCCAGCITKSKINLQSSQFLRDLTMDGDIESNPGPDLIENHSNIDSLLPHSWLWTTIVDFYGQYITEHSVKCSYLSCEALSLAITEDNLAEEERDRWHLHKLFQDTLDLMNSFRPPTKQYLFIPINDGIFNNEATHGTLLICDIKRKRYYSLDPMFTQNQHQKFSDTLGRCEDVIRQFEYDALEMRKRILNLIIDTHTGQHRSVAQQILNSILSGEIVQQTIEVQQTTQVSTGRRKTQCPKTNQPAGKEINLLTLLKELHVSHLVVKL